MVCEIPFYLIYNFFLFNISKGIIENVAEFRPGMCTEAAQQGLMQWLLKRIKVGFC